MEKLKKKTIKKIESRVLVVTVAALAQEKGHFPMTETLLYTAVEYLGNLLVLLYLFIGEIFELLVTIQRRFFWKKVFAVLY